MVLGLKLSSWIKLDITDREDRARAGGRPIDVLVSNAAVGESGSLAEVPLERVRAALETNLFATLALTQVVLKKMISRGSGTVIFISSLAGRVAAPFLMPYAMTKFSLSAAADGLRQEMAQLDRGIHIAVVEPGAFHTGFNQRMIAKKYEWMRDGSYFQSQVAELKAQEQRSNDSSQCWNFAPRAASYERSYKPWKPTSRGYAMSPHGGRGWGFD